MGNRFGEVFGGVVVIALLVLYAVSACLMITAITEACPDGPKCNPELAKEFGEGFRYVMTTVGGLVSALVIAVLSITQPGSAPQTRLLEGASPMTRKCSNAVVALYLLVWAAVGFTALIVGVMLYPNVITSVSDLGTVWLGLAVAAAYAYFGLTPPEAERPEDREDRENGPAKSHVASPTVDALETRITTRKIVFDEPALADELLGRNPGTKVTETLQKLVLHLADTVGTRIRISSLIGSAGHHAAGRAVDVGNEEIAGEILPGIVPLVGALSIDELIFDAAVAGQPDRNEWNRDKGEKRAYDSATLDEHGDHIHFSVLT